MTFKFADLVPFKFNLRTISKIDNIIKKYYDFNFICVFWNCGWIYSVVEELGRILIIFLYGRVQLMFLKISCTGSQLESKV